MQIPNTLFSENKLKDLCLGQNVTLKQKKAIKEWKERLDNNTFQGESHYKDYLRDLMIDALGYPRDKIKAEEGEKNTRMDYSYVPPSGKGGILFELKDRKKKPFKSQGYDKKEQETPIEQSLTYIGQNPDIDYAIVTNFEEFVLVTRFEWHTQCYHFKFPEKGTNLLDSKILEFATIFSKESIDSGFINKLKNETIIEEENLSDDFYTLYHQTRLMIIQAFQEKTNINHDDAIKIAQTYLNRLIFLFFAEDNGLVKNRVFSNGVLSLLDSGEIKDGTTKVSDHIQTIFSWMNEGSYEIDHKLGFNGELFKEPIDRNAFFYDFKKFDDIKNKVKLPKNVKLNKTYQKSVDRYDGQISPIIINLLIMDSYNFGGDSATGKYISVNILGHIFEQSIKDLEKLHGKEISKRKKYGVYYTPDYITTHICKNTIIPYLSKKDSTEPYQLVREYVDDITQLEKKLEEIKILDPACGSGAFLVKAVDTLISIYDEIQNFKASTGAYVVTKKGKHSGSAKVETMDKSIEMEQMRGIIQNNIYGVDINPESIELTKLSLFLKIASKNKRLVGLSQRIMHGNSLIDDKTIDDKAFDWKANFAEILADDIPDKGFDIIIGNPPYIRVQFLDHKIIDWLKQNNETAYERIDISTMFFELAKKLMKKNALVSFITSNQFLVAEYGRKSREFLLRKFRICNMVDFGDLPIFEDALTYVSIFTFENNSPSNFNYLRVNNMKDTKNIQLNNSVKIDISNLNDNSWVLGDSSKLHLLEKLKINSNIESIGRTGYGLITGADKVMLLDEDKIKNLKIELDVILPVIVGTDPEKYAKITPTTYAIYPYKIQDNETKIISEVELKKKYPNAYGYLLENKKILQDRKDSRKTFGDRKDWYGLVRFGTLENFHSEKIVTPGEVKDHKFTIDNSKSGFLGARIFCVVVTDKQYDLKYVLAILNSNVMKFFLHSTSPLKQGGYYGYSSSYLDNAPIPATQKSMQKNIAKKVEQLLEFNKNRKDKKEKFCNRLTINLDIKINKKISNFEDLEFKDFIKELSKQKIRLTLKQQDEWEEYFIDKKDMVIKNIQKTNQLESDIDLLIYKIYELNEAEIKIIESEVT